MKHTALQLQSCFVIGLIIVTYLMFAPLPGRAGTANNSFPQGSYLKATVMCGDVAPCKATAFTPKSSVELIGKVILPHTLPPGVQLVCTPVWSLEGGLRYEEAPARIVGDHVVFVKATGDFGVGGHCLEDPNVATREPVVLKSSTGPDAMSTGEAFAASLGPAAVPSSNPLTEAAQSNAPASTESSGGISSSALLIGGIVAGAAVLAVAAGAAAKSSSGGGSSSGSGSCLSAQQQQVTCNSLNGQSGYGNITFCVPTSCTCASGVAHLSRCDVQPEAVGSFECGNNSQPEYVCACNNNDGNGC